MFNHIKLAFAGSLILLASLLPIKAQQSFQFYSLDGVSQRQQLNPSFIPKHNYISIPALGNISLFGAMNVGASDFLFKRNGNLVTFLHPDVNAKSFLDNLPNKISIGSDFSLQLLGAGFKLCGGFASINFSFEEYSDITIPKELFRFAKLGMDNENISKYNINDLHATEVNFFNFQLGYARPINDKWTVGAHVNFLLGTNLTKILIDKMQISMSRDRYQIHSSNSYIAYGKGITFGNKVDDNGQMTDEIDFSDNEIKFSDIMKIKGFGMSMDLGATYKLREDLEVSATLKNLGWLNFGNMSRGKFVEDYQFDGFKFDPSNSSSLSDQAKDMEDDLKEFTKVKKDDKTYSESYALPVIFALGAKYKMPFYDKLSATGLFHSCFNKPALGTGLMIGANIEPTHWFGSSLNVDFSTVGVTPGLVLSLHPKGFNIFFGTQLSMLKLAKDSIVPLDKSNLSLNFGMDVTF